MNLALAADRGEDMRERRCIVTAETLAESELVRFVAGPDGTVVPDLAATLPGRGLWVRARRAEIERAAAKNLFSKAAGTNLRAPAGLAAHTEQLLARRLASHLGMARKAGVLVFGFDNVAKALQSASPPSVLVEARDGAPDGRRKLLALAASRNLSPIVVDCLAAEEIALALGRENVIHAALKSGRLAERLAMDASRLKGFRAPDKQAFEGSSAPHERDA